MDSALTPEHTKAIVEVANAIAAADNSGEYVAPADIEAAVTAAKHTRGLWRDDRLVGYGLVDDVFKGGIHPDHRRQGLGSELLDWALTTGPTFDLEVQSINTGAEALAVSRGFDPIRYFIVMQRPYDDAPLPPVEQQSVAFTPEYDERLRLAHNEIFADHWGTEPKTEDDWRTWFTGHRAFRADHSRLIVDEDRIASYALAYEFDADTEATGVRELWIGQVGTRREDRGRGLGTTAVSAVLQAGAEAGFERAGLGVDSANLTGAERIYARLGFETVSTKILYRRTA
ncbi:GNAT family N-acetyltransferase [Kribbella yunnanensis]|uniref:GNAT family N-acetyltransferase n=1 Tax=Kribbella yunnanensis TaxID=190194 RepID=A0ABN2IL91_9ACTN